MVLWVKESNSADAKFVDLFFNANQIKDHNEWNRQIKVDHWMNIYLFKKYKPGKSNATSDQFRSDGNKYFYLKQYTLAMELYSLSLCFAEPGTDNVSFAYANRTACFLEKGMFDECLRDIELAAEANYPKMAKLMDRKAKCERLMKRAAPKEKFAPKLSFPPNKKFPCMADVLEIQQNNEFGRHIVATRDIDVGQTVLIEESFVSSSAFIDHVQCSTCLQSNKNFIACPTCTDVMFCDLNCEKRNEVHRKFCGLAIHRMPGDVKYVAKSILIALIAFPNTSELMDFVCANVLKHGKEVPAAADSPRSKYGLFLNLQPAKEDKLDVNTVYKIFIALLSIPTIKSMFACEASQRFLMHLIGEHYLIISNNSYGGPLTDASTMSTTSLVMSLFNHACAPNVFNSSIGNTDVCITMRPIKKGEQLFVKYLCGERTTRQRQDLLLNQWGFLCKCDKCKPRFSNDDCQRMQNDPLLRQLASKSHSLLYGVTDFKSLSVKCEKFLQKYGHLPWSEEIDMVLKIYTKCVLDKFPYS